MNVQPRCIVCTRDPQLRQRLDGFLRFHASLTFTTDVAGALLVLEQQQLAILLIDLRTEDALSLLVHLKKTRPSTPVLAFAASRSAPALEAARIGVYAVQELQFERQALQNLVERASDFLSLSLENRMLELERASPPVEDRPKHQPWERAQQSTISGISKAFRCLDDVDSLLLHVVESISSSVVASRAGLVALSTDSNTFLVRASLRCLPETTLLRFPVDGALARSFQARAQLVSRLQLNTQRSSDWAILTQALDDHRADVLVPLFGKAGLLGWLFLGSRATAVPYDHDDLETLMLLGENLSAAVEKALLYERSGLQKQLLESLFDSLPSGILAVNEANTVLWLNQAAESVLGVAFDEVVNQPTDRLGERVAGFIQRAQVHPGLTLKEIVRLRSGTVLELSARRLRQERSFQGLLLTLEDVSTAEALKQERDRILRSEILAEMCQNMAVEIRAPLTAIQTFTQLLPERHADRDFRDRFESIVTQEVQRLTELSKNIGVATRLFHPNESAAASTFEPAQAIEMAKCLLGPGWETITCEFDHDLPSIEGNCERIAECMCHLLSNAREATVSLQRPRISLKIKRAKVSKNVDAIECSVHDNRPVRKVGAFVDNSSLGSTENVRRADLRLSFAAEIIRDHAGVMEVAASTQGVCVSFLLPVSVHV